MRWSQSKLYCWPSFPVSLLIALYLKSLPLVTPLLFNPLPVTLLSFLSVINPFLFPPCPPSLSLAPLLPLGRMTATPRSQRCSGRGTVSVSLSLSVFPFACWLTRCHLVSTSRQRLTWPLHPHLHIPSVVHVLTADHFSRPTQAFPSLWSCICGHTSEPHHFFFQAEETGGN